MSTKKRKEVIEFTAKMTRNAELIFSIPTFELEEGLVLKRTNRKRKKIIGYETCYNIFFNEHIIGVLNAIPTDTEGMKVKSMCNIRFNESIYENDEFEKVLKRLIDNEFPLIEIIEIKFMQFPTGFGKINPLFIRHAEYFDDEIIKRVKEEICMEMACFEMCWNDGIRNFNYKPSVITNCLKLANAYRINHWFEEIMSNINYC
jgi:hypothetical protein